jgi:ribokinase
MRVAVVGHVEWIEFARVEHLPAAGEIVHATDVWQLPAGGGAVAAVQLAKLAGECTFFTALADDELGRRAKAELEGLGVRVEAAPRPAPQRRGFVHIDDQGERTITVIGERIAPAAADPLPWDDLAETDAVYVTAGDAGAMRRAREARKLVATTRALGVLTEAGVRLDALVSSASDAGEHYEAGTIDPEPDLVVRTAGAKGGTATHPDGHEFAFSPVPLPGPPVDTYGAGDSFAAGLTYGLAAETTDEALRIASRCGAANITGRGPYEGQLRAADLP